MLSAMYYSYRKRETLSDCQYEDGGWGGCYSDYEINRRSHV